MKRLFPLAVLVCASSLPLAGGCASVAPYEREQLAHPEMADEPAPEAARFDAHVAGAKEGALDPGATGGGGCGCN